MKQLEMIALVMVMLEARITALEKQSGRTNVPQHEECVRLIGRLKGGTSDAT